VIISVDSGLDSALKTLTFAHLGLTLLAGKMDRRARKFRQEFGEQGAGKKFEVFCKWFLEDDLSAATSHPRTR
jgi:hypothetical protein